MCTGDGLYWLLDITNNNYYIINVLYWLSVHTIYTVLEQRARVTRDIDLLAYQEGNLRPAGSVEYYIQNILDEMVRIFREIAMIPSDDAVSFDTEAITVERIKEDADYQGIRIKLTGFLDRSRPTLKLIPLNR
jgi:hypothetical protein